MTQIFYHGRDNLDYIVTFSIEGTIYDYYLPNLGAVEAIDYMAMRWQGKAFNVAKRLATRTVRREQ